MGGTFYRGKYGDTGKRKLYIEKLIIFLLTYEYIILKIIKIFVILYSK